MSTYTRLNQPALQHSQHVQGGYKDTQTGLQYHHGYTQTGPPKPLVPAEIKNHRDTQTYFMRNRKTDKEYARATQARSINVSTIYMCGVKQFCRSPLGTFTYRQFVTKLLLPDHTKLLMREKSVWTLKEKSEQFKDTSGKTT